MNQKIIQAFASGCCAVAMLGAEARAQQPAIGSGADLVEACRQSSTDAPEQAGLCEGFLLGYLEASTDVVFTEQLPSGYMQRVMRTRAPVHPETSAMKTPTYCLEGIHTIEALRAEIAAVDPSSVGEVPAASVVQDLLEAGYLCR